MLGIDVADLAGSQLDRGRAPLLEIAYSST